MRTLVVPVDFSAASINAANYAFEFAKAIKGSMVLMHVHQLPIAYAEAPLDADAVTTLIEEANHRLHELKEEFLGKAGNVTVYTATKEGYVTTQIEEYCKLVHPYAVVMGAKGSTAAERVLFGSNTLAAMKFVQWPLIIVPAGGKFKTIEKIGLACDLQNVPQTVHAAEIKNLVNDFHAQLHILHIVPGKNKAIGDEEIEGSEWLSELLTDVKPQFHFLNEEDVEAAINNFAETQNLDLLIVIPQKHVFPAGIFHKSQSKQIALHAHIPLMSIHE